VTWFKVDDGFWSHPKTLALSPEAVALWTRAGSYCGKHLTDGFVLETILPMLQGTPQEADELVRAGLWCPVEGGWEFHDWTAYQDTREAVERRREAWKDRQRRHRTAESVDENGEPVKKFPSLPFPSKGTRDSRRDTLRDSRGVSRRDIEGPTPTPPPLAAVMAELEAKVTRDNEVPF
jgi:hypothetical protein